MPMGIPEDAIVHFKAAFDIKGSSTDSVIDDLRYLIRGYLQGKVNRPVRDPKFFFGGLDYTDKSTSYSTASEQGDDPNHPPYWVFQFAHRDSQFTHRWWSIEIGITNHDNKLLRFVILNKWWISSKYVGDNPALPSPASPRIVQDIVSDDRWTCYGGSLRLLCRPWIIELNQGKDFCETIQDPNRTHPIILINPQQNDSKPCLDEKKLSRLLSGSAQVYINRNENLNEEIQFYISREYACLPGAIRIYFPRLNPKVPYDYKNHRFLSASDIEEKGSSSILEIIVSAIARRSGVFRYDEVFSHQHIHQLGRKKRISRLLEDIKNKETEFNQNDFDTLVEDFTQLEAENKRLSSDYLDSEEKREILEEEIKQLRYKCDSFEAEYDRKSKEAENLESKVALLDVFDHLPEALSDLVKMGCKLFSDRLVFSDDAFSSSSSYDLDSKCLPDAWRLLWHMNNSLWPIFFEDSVSDIESAFKIKSGFELAMSEGCMTKNDNKLMRQRNVFHDGKQYQMIQHVKFGNRPRKQLRIHFFVLDEAKMILIGHCGDHLDTFSGKNR